MPNEAISLIRAKLARAESKTDELEAKIARFWRMNSVEVISEVNARRTERHWRFQLKHPVPVEFSLDVAEIIQNLRTPLDNIVSNIALLAHKTVRSSTAFPFGRDKTHFEEQLKQKCAQLPPDAITMLREVGPYAGGNDVLWDIHRFDVANKHPGLRTVLLDPGFQFTTLTVTGGLPFVLGSRTGRHMLMSGYTLAIDPLTVPKDLEFLTTEPNAVFRTDASPKFDIVFRDGEAIKGHSLIPALRMMRSHVDVILSGLEERFFKASNQRSGEA